MTYQLKQIVYVHNTSSTDGVCGGTILNKKLNNGATSYEIMLERIRNPNPPVMLVEETGVFASKQEALQALDSSMKKTGLGELFERHRMGDNAFKTSLLTPSLGRQINPNQPTHTIDDQAPENRQSVGGRHHAATNHAPICATLAHVE